MIGVPVLEYCSVMQCGARQQIRITMDRVVSGASFLTMDVIEFELLIVDHSSSSKLCIYLKH